MCFCGHRSKDRSLSSVCICPLQDELGGFAIRLLRYLLHGLIGTTRQQVFSKEATEARQRLSNVFVALKALKPCGLRSQVTALKSAVATPAPSTALASSSTATSASGLEFTATTKIIHLAFSTPSDFSEIVLPSAGLDNTRIGATAARVGKQAKI